MRVALLINGNDGTMLLLTILGALAVLRYRRVWRSMLVPAKLRGMGVYRAQEAGYSTQLVGTLTERSACRDLALGCTGRQAGMVFRDVSPIWAAAGN